MKFNITIDTEDYDYESEIKEEVIERVVDEICQNIIKQEYFKEFKETVWKSRVEYTLKNKVEDMFSKIKNELEKQSIDKLVERIENKRDYQERVFKVKPFSEVTKENEEYLNELVDKAIARRFGK